MSPSPCPCLTHCNLHSTKLIKFNSPRKEQVAALHTNLTALRSIRRSEISELGTHLSLLLEERLTVKEILILTLNQPMYIYGAPCKARNFNVVYIWTYVWQCWKPPLSICWTMFQHRINPESFPVSQLCVNTLPATKITLITDGI
jgi:hypothetical protein